MSEHLMAAVLYVPVPDGDAPPTLEALATRAGLAPVHHEAGAVPALYGTWGVMTSVRAVRQVLSAHVCLQLYPHLNDLLDRQSNDAADAMPIAESFRAACEALQPDAALFFTRPNEVEAEYIDAQYPKLLGLDSVGLDASSSALLYLDAELSDYLPEACRRNRDSLAVRHGLLLFRGTGAQRWW